MKPASYYNTVYSGKYHVDEARVRHMVAFCKGRVLDVGCGDGALARVWTGECMGIDFSPKAIEIAKKRKRHFACLDFLAEPLPAGPWDTIILGEVLEHLTQEAGNNLLAKCANALAADGRIVISVPNGDMIPDPAHVRTFTESNFPGAIVNTFGSYLVAVIDRNRPKLSAVLIVKDEEPMLEGCLKSLEGVWDELVVVDTGSTDRTVEIAKSFGARIGYFEWCDDSGKARAYAETLCLGEWILWQDADEVLREGKDAIREHLDNPDLSAVRPQLVFDKDSTGRPTQVFFRQELLHRNNGWRWHGAAHPYFTGRGKVIKDPRIRQEHLQRPGGDRPNFKSSLDAMRKNLGGGFEQRHLYYLARQHWYNAHYQEAIALVDLLLAQPSHWDIERSSAAIIKGDCYRALEMPNESQLAYLQAIKEYGKWAEPYYCLGRCEYERQNYTAGASWYYASLPWSPPDYFVDMSIYEWRRYDMLSVCLYRMGKSEEAIKWNTMALAIQPTNQRLLTNQGYYERALPQINMFSELVIETHGYCNRKCKTCLRQTYPDRSVLSGRGENETCLPDDVVYRLIDEAAEMGFTGWICLQDFNEPLFDERIPAFAKYAKDKGVFKEVYANTNGDLLDKKLAQQLDGNFDRLHIALYGGNQEERKAKYSSWFKKTKLTWGGNHVVTHYSPLPNLQKCLDAYRDSPCLYEVDHRLIISYTGEMALCCEDIAGAWDLGNVQESSLKDLWFSPKHTEIVKTLSTSGGRKQYPYCQECPRPSPGKKL